MLKDPFFAKKFRDRNFDYAKSYDHMGQIIYQDESQGLTIHAGQIFEAYTVKGNTNLIVAMRSTPGFLIYVHADKVKKAPIEHFIRAVLSGELQPRTAKEVDTERLFQFTIGLDAIANRRTGEEQIECMGTDALHRFQKGA